MSYFFLFLICRKYKYIYVFVLKYNLRNFVTPCINNKHDLLFNYFLIMVIGTGIIFLNFELSVCKKKSKNKQELANYE